MKTMNEELKKTDGNEFDYIFDFLNKDVGIWKHLDDSQKENLQKVLKEVYNDSSLKKSEVSFDLKVVDPAGKVKDLSKTEVNKLSKKAFPSPKDVAEMKGCKGDFADELFAAAATVTIPLVKYIDKKTGEENMIVQAKELRYKNKISGMSIPFYYGKGKPFSLDQLKAMMSGKTVLKRDIPLYVKGLDGTTAPRLGKDGEQIKTDYWCGFNKKEEKITIRNDFYLKICSSKTLGGKDISEAQLDRLAQGKALLLSVPGSDKKELYSVNVFTKEGISTPETRAKFMQEKSQSQKLEQTASAKRKI